MGRLPGQWNRVGAMAILADQHVQMANLCVWACHGVNGVSQLHGKILVETTFRDQALLEPAKFMAITNGITHRRWLMEANPGLAALADETIGDAWRREADRLALLLPFAQDAAFRQAFARVKQQNKARLAEYLRLHQGVTLHTDALLDVQAKRLHEYKRQLMNILDVIRLYNRVVLDGAAPSPRAFVFAAKASPGYYRAKEIIRLINTVGRLVEQDPKTRDLLQVIFLENYSVSSAEILIPAAEISQQLSTAGKEASGTGNMKFMMNGALTLGTLDGANVEIAQAVGRENIFIFGLGAQQADALVKTGAYRSYTVLEQQPEIKRAMERLVDGSLGTTFPDLYHALVYGDPGQMADPYLVLRDLSEFSAARSRAAQSYAQPEAWWTKAVVNTAASGIFSSDRTIEEYNQRIWHLPKLHFE